MSTTAAFKVIDSNINDATAIIGKFYKFIFEGKWSISDLFDQGLTIKVAREERKLKYFENIKKKLLGCDLEGIKEIEKELINYFV